MNRLEAIKAMLDGKKIGHPKLTNDAYYVLENSANPIRLNILEDDDSMVANMSYDEGYYIIKNKVKKYKVLFIRREHLGMEYPYLMISGAFYKGIDDFRDKHKDLIPLQLLASTMIEVEE